MTTLHTEIEEDCRSRLAAEANRLGVSIEQYASLILSRHVQFIDQPVRPMSRDEFQIAMQKSLTENAELYRRLAQ